MSDYRARHAPFAIKNSTASLPRSFKSPRGSFLYINDDQQLTGLRYDNWKLAFMEQRAPGTMLIWANLFTITALWPSRTGHF